MCPSESFYTHSELVPAELLSPNAMLLSGHLANLFPNSTVHALSPTVDVYVLYDTDAMLVVCLLSLSCSLVRGLCSQ